MSVPNLKHIVQQVRNSRTWDFSTKDGLCAYSGAVVEALHAADPNFGHLKKRSPKNGCYPAGLTDGRAIDAALYKPTGQAVDFIGSAGVNQPNPVAWSIADPVGKYGPDSWFAPTVTGTIPTVPPPVVPNPDQPPGVGLESQIQDLDRRVQNLFALHEEVVNQLGLINEAIRSLSERPTLGAHVHPVRIVSLFGRSYEVETGGPR